MKDFDLRRVRLRSGDQYRDEVDLELEPFELGGQRYAVGSTEVRLDVSRTTGGYALRLRSHVRLEGPCVRCLEEAGGSVSIDAREVDQPGGGDDMDSPYIDGDDLRLAAWTRDALVLALPSQILCRAECRGLCALCGADLNSVDGEHRHESAPDPRWAKLGELRFE